MTEELGITGWQRICHELAVAKGWWNEPTAEQKRVAAELAVIALEHAKLSRRLEAIRNGKEPVDESGDHYTAESLLGFYSYETIEDLSKMALIHSEVSEAVECVLTYELEFDERTGKPEGAVVELADVVIRILDWCGRKKLKLVSAMSAKHNYNATRPTRHGDKLA